MPTMDGETLSIGTPTPTQVLHALTGWALARGEELPALSVTRPTLEDVYLRLVGGTAGQDDPAANDPTVGAT